MSQASSAPPPASDALDRALGDPRLEGRETNIVEPALSRRRRRPHAPTGAAAEPASSIKAGDIPAALASRYFSEPSHQGRRIAFYEGPGAKRAAFHDHGERLTTTQTHPTIARDLAKIAQHRGWSAVRVTGEDEFRRQSWLEARALGLEVKGYKPRVRDEQELTARLHADRKPERPGSAGRASPAGDATRAPARERFEAEGVIVEVGRAPYRRRTDAPLTPFVRLQRDRLGPLDVWGSRLPDAIAKAHVAVGDRVRISRDAVERLERSRARTPSQDRAERFRTTTPALAARDPDLGGAQSHLAVLDAVIDRLVLDPGRRARLHSEARAIIADELAQGRRFSPARVRDVEPVLRAELASVGRGSRRPSADRASER